MNNTNEIGFGTRVTTTGTLAIGAGNNIALLGILNGAVTSPLVQIWHGQGTAAGATIIGGLTCALNGFTPIKAYCSGGAFFNFTGVVPDLTIYWNPLG